jgi:hypothetical protein
MSEYIYIFITLLAAFHALTYARWLRMNGNKAGAYGVLVIILIALALSLLRLASQ